MKGKTNVEIKKEREEAIRCAKEMMSDEVEVIDSFFENAPAEAKPLWYLGESLKLLSTADVAFLQQVGKTHAAAKSSIPVRNNMVSTPLRNEKGEILCTREETSTRQIRHYRKTFERSWKR